MAWFPKEREVQALLSADARRRYAYFVRQVCDTEALWGLFDDGWASLGDEEDNHHLALWPHEIYAQRMAVDAWETYSPVEIPFWQFLREWLPQLSKEKVSLAVFPTPTGAAVTTTAEKLEKDLKASLPEFFGENSSSTPDK